MSTSKDHKRVLETFLRPIEKPVLYGLAARTPAWMTPDHLTLIGTIGAFIIFLSYLLSRNNPVFLWLATVGLIINWYGDSLDGTLARHRKIQRPKYGFFVDHTVDAFNEMLIVVGLGLTVFVRLDVAALALVGYLMMLVYVYVRTVVEDVFQISYGRLGPTEVRVILAALNAAMFFFGAPGVTTPLGRFTVYDIAVLLVAVVLVLIFVVSSYTTGKELAKVDPPPAPGTR